MAAWKGKHLSLKNNSGEVLEAEEAGSVGRREMTALVGTDSRKLEPWSLMIGTGYLAGATGALDAHFSVSPPALSHMTKDRHQNYKTNMLLFPHRQPPCTQHTASLSGSRSLSSSIFLPFSPLLTSSPFQVGPLCIPTLQMF